MAIESVLNIAEDTGSEYLIFSKNTGSFLDRIFAAEPQPTSPKVDRILFDGIGEVHYWGIDNLYPKRVYEEAKKNDLVSTVINDKISLAVSGGWTYGKVRRTEQGKVLDFAANQKLEAFLRTINFDAYLDEAFSDLYWFANFFPEIIFYKNEIIATTIQEAMFVRYAKQNEKGLVNWAFVNANWELYTDEKSTYTSKIAVFDRYTDPVLWAKNYPNLQRAIYPVSLPSAGAVSYQLADWHSIIESKWLAYANRIPTLKEALIKHQFSATHLVKINSQYYAKRFKDKWKDTAQRDSLVSKVRKEIEDFLMGTENAGKALFITTEFDELSNETRNFIEIELIPNNIEKGFLVDDSVEASSHILAALGMPATLIGNIPGKGGAGAGSGSDIKEALRLYNLKISRHRRLVLEPFNRFILPYMGFADWEIKLLDPIIHETNELSPIDRTPKSNT